jgi:hypothetical protein
VQFIARPESLDATDQRKIDLLEVVHGLVFVRREQDEAGVGASFAVAPGQWPEKAARHAGRCGDGDLRVPFLRSAQGVDRRADRAQPLLDGLEQQQSVGGQRHRVVVAVEQAALQRFLEEADLLTDCHLRHVQLFGGAGETERQR